MRVLLSRFLALFRRRRRDEDLSAEIQFHLDSLATEYEARGMDPKEACLAAHKEFGGPEQIKEEYRAARGFRVIEALVRDVQLAVRSLAKSPGFAFIVVLTLALGIGANATIFSVARTVLMSPGPYPAERPEDVYVLNETAGSDTGVSYLDFRDWQARAESFEVLAAFRPTSGNITNVDEPFRVEALMVTWDYFRLMGVEPVLGRLISPEEDSADGPAVGVLSHLLWVNRFGSDPDVIGKTIHNNRRPRVIIGVLPPDFELIPEERLYIDLSHLGASRNRRVDHDNIRAIGRLKRSVTEAQARAEMATINAALEAEYPETNAGIRVTMTSLRDARVGSVKTMMHLLLGAVFMVLLVACFNIANLQLARRAARSRESAIRDALGAGRWRLMSHSLAESVVLALVGGVAALGVAFAGIEILHRLGLAELPRGTEVAVDWGVVLFATAVAGASGLAVGAAPALKAARGMSADPLTSGARSTGAPDGALLRRAFLLAQVAVAMVLLTGAGLLVRTVQQLRAVDPGFRVENLLTLRLTLFGDGHGWRSHAYDRVTESIEGLPGIESVSYGVSLPLERGLRDLHISFTVEGRPEPEPSHAPTVALNPVGLSYLETTGIPLLGGRFFGEFDNRESPPLVVVNQTLAQRYWPDGAVGRQIRFGRPGAPFRPPVEIIGVVGDVRQDALDQEPVAEMYMSMAQYPASSARFIVRTSGEPGAMMQPVRDAVRRAAPGLPIGDLRTMDEVIDASLASRRLLLNLFLAFAVLGVLLAATGLYGVVAYSVVRRTREIGLRMAIGARPSDVVALVLRQDFLLALAAVGVGALAAAGLGRFMEGVLYGVDGWDPVAVSSAALVLLLAAAAACLVPGYRAASIEPTTALREE